MAEKFIAPLLAALTLLLAGALAAMTHAQRKAVGAARELNALNETELQQKELMLQEMKHRIKNSIARIMAIARQTVHSSQSLSDFDQSFSARMQAMATAQDVLTRSHWERASLRELLETELKQVFGETFDLSNIKGPKLELNEKAAQSFGLTFHELATNALKYGTVEDGVATIEVEWEHARVNNVETLQLLWREPGASPGDSAGNPGFGTRLMQVSIAGELGGQIERDITPKGLEVTIKVPSRNLS